VLQGCGSITGPGVPFGCAGQRAGLLLPRRVSGDAMIRVPCAHCGLPVLAARDDGTRRFCCWGCELISRIIKGRDDADGVHAWTLLRLGIGALFAMNVMMVALLLYTGAVEPAAQGAFRWVMLALAAPAMAILGHGLVVAAAREMRHRRLSLDTMVAVGAAASFGVSTVNVLRGEGEVYFDTATMLLVLVTLGKLIEATARTKAMRLTRSPRSLLPAEATVLTEQGQCAVPAPRLAVGQRILSLRGERLACDGVVVEGSSFIDEAAFTGEPAPRPVGPGDRVFAGALNTQGPLVIEATAVGGEMLVDRLVALVSAAAMRPGGVQRMADRVASVAVPAVIALAAATLLAWLPGGLGKAAMAALSVLVVTCPCAVGIAAPLAASLSIAAAGRRGVLIRGGDILERLGLLRVLMMDKTGTLTLGEPLLTHVRCADGTEDEELLASLAVLESRSEHALARAAVAAAASRSLPGGVLEEVHLAPGGLEGLVQMGGRTRRVSAGSADFCAPLPHLAPQEQDGTLVWVGWDGATRGCVVFRDVPRPGADEAVAALKRLGVEPVLLSGDRLAAAGAIAQRVGIQRVLAPRTPGGKLDEIAAARRDGLVGMVGDGVNDAPALAAADVGIAMAGGADLARDVGDVVLLHDGLEQLPWLIELGRRTRRVILQNLIWAMVYNAAALAAAAMGLLHPLLAAVAMAVSSLTLTLNSLRLAGPDRPGEQGKTLA
jgi:heavy metal translocating P-type ATPase